MAAPVKSSRWGSFLQQAVAGVEARLDNILAEGEDGNSSGQPDAAQSATTSIRDQQPLNGISRSSTSSRTNDRLQERLAKAMASKTAQQSDARSISSDSCSARPSTDVGQPEVLPPQFNHTAVQDSTFTTAAAIAAEMPRSPFLISSKTSYSQCSEESHEPQALSVKHLDSSDDVSDANESTIVASELPKPSAGTETHQSECFHCRTYLGHIAVLEGSLEQTKREQQEETHRYVEQFEALQAKLQFLARDATDAARKSAANAPTGSFDKKLAERDEKIAVLLEEGRKLAATELKHRSIIRKLRSQLSNIEKELAEERARLEKATADLETLRPGATRAEELEQSTNDLQIRLNGVRDEMNALRANVVADKSTIQQLREGLAKARDQASLAATKASEESVNLEKRRIKDLEDTVAALILEKNLVTERAKITIVEAEESAKTAAERSRVTELEMRAELQSMESKLEAMRALAEEASSGAIGDSQTKILRQVDTLQTQHAIATENWQGIEASLLTRVGNLERERDEALRRESEMRKKARETATRCKLQDEELQELTSKFPHYHNDIEAYQSQIGTLSQRAYDAETALAQVRSELDRQQAAWKVERAESERRPWPEDHLAGSAPRMQSRPDSPLLSVLPRTLSSDLLLAQTASVLKGRKVSTPTSGTDGFQDVPSPIGRLSSQPPSRPMTLPGPNLPVAPSFTSFELPSESLPPTTSQPSERDDLFDGVETTSSPLQMMQDMVSVSTVAAGPSVQLVERMSAAVRRLEAERVTSREELSRISAQRDEARAEMVALMKELESNKNTNKRVSELEAEVKDVHSRYQTTLELLGERSEEANELRADVEDLKAMYRDLVERTVR